VGVGHERVEKPARGQLGLNVNQELHEPLTVHDLVCRDITWRRNWFYHIYLEIVPFGLILGIIKKYTRHIYGKSITNDLQLNFSNIMI